MGKLVLVSFDEEGDNLLKHLRPLLKGIPHKAVAKSFSSPGVVSTLANGNKRDLRKGDELRILGKMDPKVKYSDLKVSRLITPGITNLDVGGSLEDDQGLFSDSLFKSKRNLSTMLISDEDSRKIDSLLEGLEKSDLVLTLIDADSKEMIIPASIFSHKAIGIGCLSLCIILRKEFFRDIGHVHEVNRTYLELSMGFHGAFAIPPPILNHGEYLLIAHGIRHLTQMMFRSGLVNLDHADLLMISRGGRVLIMTWGSAAPGGDPSATSIDDALTNPMCYVDLTTVKKALVNVVGSGDLKLEDSLVSSEVLKRRIMKDARIIWGVTIDEDPDEDLEVFIVLSTTPLELLLHWYSRN